MPGCFCSYYYIAELDLVICSIYLKVGLFKPFLKVCINFSLALQGSGRVEGVKGRVGVEREKKILSDEDMRS